MWYYNGAGRLLYASDLPLEPPDCWGEEEPDDEDREDTV